MLSLQKTIHERHQLLIEKEISAQELCAQIYARIEEVEDQIKALILTLERDKIMKEAQKIDHRIAMGETISSLAGMPMVLKDNICTKGIKTTCSSRMLADFHPLYDAAVAEKLTHAGAVLCGKANMDEFAMGSSTENSGYYPTRNPWDLNRVPGGSSGGSAAAVASDEAVFSLGSDTAGSIRQPASFCGVVGLKPTYGLVSRYGLIAYASSMDQIGPITKDVTDAALVLQAIAGHDKRDSTSSPIPVPNYQAALTGEMRGLNVGIPKEYFGPGLEPEVKECVEKAIRLMESVGAKVAEVSLPHTEYALPAYYLIAPVEAASNLVQYGGRGYGHQNHEVEDVVSLIRKTRKFGFGNEVKRRIIIGTYIMWKDIDDNCYLKASKVRTLVKQDFDRAFEKFDLLAAPTVSHLPFRQGEKKDDPIAIYSSDLLTVPVNLAGIPAISIPCGLVRGLPVGLQLIGKPFDEETLFQAAFAYEKVAEWDNIEPLFGL